MITTDSPRTTDEPRTPGAHRARSGEYVFDLASINELPGGPGYSPLFGGCVEGERIIVALMKAPAGRYSDYHSHPNEQWVYVVKGSMDLVVDGVTHRAGPGKLVYIPANTVHRGGTPGDEDAVVLTFKDASHGLHGIKADA